NFKLIAESLQSAVDEVVISYVHPYTKTQRNMSHAAASGGFSWEAPSDAERTDLTCHLRDIANDNEMSLSVCAQPQNLVDGVHPARCVDARRLEDVSAT